MSGAVTWLRRNWLWLAVNVGAALPLVWMAWDYTRGEMIDPIDSFTIRTGHSAIILLLLTLAITPLVTVSGFRKLIGTRKSLGLWAFAYASLHLLVFVGLEYNLSLEYILRDGLATKRYIIAGTAALLIMLPMAITSTRGWMKRLGRNWKRLHQWIYAAGVLAVVHYIWVAKIPVGKPTLYAVILAVLLAARIPIVRKLLANLGRRLRNEKTVKPQVTTTPATLKQ